jgi:H+/Cl- antiporter ClcA/predicted transcriptional regulator
MNDFLTARQARTASALPSVELPGDLGDFTATKRLIPITCIAIVIGAVSACLALALLRLIGIFTNLFFFQRWDSSFVSPATNTLGWLAIVVPVAGGLVIGFMARFGSERIRGHGIPEALEAILTRGSRVEPKLAVLKPLSAAISIGSGGPFGAEGPIIMTGGAFGSMIAQLFRLTAAERKTLLVSGAVAGMSATFAAPIASVLLAVELLLFELKPRSFVPVALASATAQLCRAYLLGEGPLFSVPEHPSFIGPKGLAACAFVGLLAGVLALLMTLSVYAWEDLFKRLPIHWMWWPAVGGIAVGIGGLVYPRALGVGYDTIETLLQGGLPRNETLLLVAVKWSIWSVYLGSGTSGGVLAPLLMIGASLGELVGSYLPFEGVGFYPLVAMGAVLGGTMRSPLTGIVFASELTGDRNMMLPLLVASTLAHAFTVLAMRRSILTEKVARRGFHVTREYAIDPLDVLFVRDVMQTTVVGLPAEATVSDIGRLLATKLGELEPLYPIVEADRFVGVVSQRSLQRWVTSSANDNGDARRVTEITKTEVVTAYADEPLRAVVQRMAESGHTRLPVVERNGGPHLLGLVTLTHALKAQRRHLEEEQRRERTLEIGILLPSFLRAFRSTPSSRSDRARNAPLN